MPFYPASAPCLLLLLCNLIHSISYSLKYFLVQWYLNLWIHRQRALYSSWLESRLLLSSSKTSWSLYSLRAMITLNPCLAGPCKPCGDVVLVNPAYMALSYCDPSHKCSTRKSALFSLGYANLNVLWTCAPQTCSRDNTTMAY